MNSYAKYIGGLQQLTESLEPETAHLVNRAVALLGGQQKLSFEELLRLNLSCITEQMHALKPQHRKSLLQALAFERQSIFQDINADEDVIFSTAIARTLQQVVCGKDDQS